MGRRRPRHHHLALTLALGLGALTGQAVADTGASAVQRVAPADDVPAGLQCLWHAYPDHVCQVKANTLVWCDGAEMVYDTGEAHASHDDLLNHADLQDMMAMPYPVGADAPSPPAVNFEPGRVRHEPFFRKLYGDSRKAVSRQTKAVRWFGGKRVRVTTVNGVHERLEAARDALRKLPPAEQRFVETTAGTFNWRTISGTPRLSMHSFAVAIDVGVPHADYWKWSKPASRPKVWKRTAATAKPASRPKVGKRTAATAKDKTAEGALVYRNRFPMSVVTAFEAQGFIWGGKWYHFDTMHFEYRPELLHARCAR